MHGLLFPWRAGARLSAFLTAALLAGAAAAQGAQDAAGAEDLRLLLSRAGRTVLVDGQPVDAAPLRGLYRWSGHEPVWVQGNRLNRHGREALAAMAEAARDGLDAGDYDVTARLDSLARAGEGTEMDLLVSATLVRYASDLRGGRLSPKALDPDLFVFERHVDGAGILIGAASATDLGEYLDSLAPGSEGYLRLREALARYRSLAAAGGWPRVPAGPALKRGAREARVGTLRRFLAAAGDLADAGETPEPTLFDTTLEAAVRRFQERMGLAPDGVVGPLTLREINRPIADRVRRIALNLERLRWNPDDLGERHVTVNMAAFKLEAVEAGAAVVEMRVVVGRPYRRTPVFSDRIIYLEFNPYWTVPARIARVDLVPKLRANPDYFAEQGIRVFSGWGPEAEEIDPARIDWSRLGRRLPYRLRQEPGPRNVLGRVKFMFPNRFDVYLHDTPDEALFARAIRAFSSGCIRVEKPATLAAFLLQDTPGWTPERIAEAMAGKKTFAVRLVRPVPIHLTYQTAWVDRDGTVQFRDDIYGRDARLAAALFGRR